MYSRNRSEWHRQARLSDSDSDRDRDRLASGSDYYIGAYRSEKERWSAVAGVIMHGSESESCCEDGRLLLIEQGG